MENANHKAYKYRFYPTPEQEGLLLRTFGCARFVYNKALEFRKKSWEENKTNVSFADTCRMLTAWRNSEEFSFLKEVSAVALQQSLRHLQVAYENFFRKTAGYPRFKHRRNKQSITLTNSGFRIKGKKVKLAKMREPLNIRWSKQLPKGAKPTSVTVSVDKAGRWHIVFLVEEEIRKLPEVGNNMGNKVGIDLGVKDFAVTSDGKKYDAPKISRRKQAQLRRAQKEISRREKASRNREKSRQKLAKLHVKEADRRRDFNHKLSTKIISENQVIIVEDLNVKGMTKNGGAYKRGLNRVISRSALSEFVNMLEYKAKWYGRTLIKVDRWFPSTQICSKCKARTGPKGDLSVRTWTCNNCGNKHDRDINAARNILAAVLAVTACGDEYKTLAC